VNADGDVTCLDWFDLRAKTGTVGPILVACDIERGPVLPQPAPLAGLPDVGTRELNFGETIEEQSFDVRVTGKRPRYVVDSDASWISLSARAAPAPNVDTIVVSVSRAALPPGDHVGRIAITAPRERGLREVIVRVTVPPASSVDVPDSESAELAARAVACGSAGATTMSAVTVIALSLLCMGIGRRRVVSRSRVD
jgi:hypothetical protein